MMEEIIELLKDLRFYMDSRADADWQGESYVVNEEMKFYNQIDSLLQKIDESKKDR